MIDFQCQACLQYGVYTCTLGAYDVCQECELDFCANVGCQYGAG
jgi:hypothetical protein